MAWIALALVAVVLSTALGEHAEAASPQRPPNVVIILADDMGYSDLGCYGGEISTPNLDSLAASGLRFTQFYNTARCWPSRAALLTGYYAQQVPRDELPGLGGGGRGRRQHWARLLPDFLKAKGYHSYHSGKWHIDGPVLASGFEHSYMGEGGRFFEPKTHFEDDVKLPAVERGSGYYSTTVYADHAIGYLQQHQQQHADKPFFLYLAFIAPHFPLQAPPEDIAKYKGTYRDGWDVMRQARFERQRKMGLVDTTLSALEEQIGPPYAFPDAIKQLGAGEVTRPVPWDQLTKEQQEFQATKMSIHAAMVDRIDQEVGRVLNQIRAMQAWENTLILFLSDNGASAEIMIRDEGHDPQAPPGSAASYLCLGPGFSSACNTPFRRHKTWVHEGGISTPLIVHWPNGIAARGELRHAPGHVIDIVPTVLDVTGIDKPKTWDGEEIPAAPGISLLPDFSRDNATSPRELWWLHEGNRALREGDWKIVAARGDPWELYDLSRDRAESNNLAAQHPEKVQQMAHRWEEMFNDDKTLAGKTPELGRPPAKRNQKK
jgi:arylsulfatase